MKFPTNVGSWADFRLVVPSSMRAELVEACPSTGSGHILRIVSRFPPREVAKALANVRAACLKLPETSERPSHGGPAFFIQNKRCFVMFLDDHHGDGRLAIWCAAPDGVQADLIETEPDRFFRPPYVGHLGWLGVQLPGIADAELRAICQEAFTTVAPRNVLKMLGSQHAE
jgi:hypothetical protein